MDNNEPANGKIEEATLPAKPKKAPSPPPKPGKQVRKPSAPSRWPLVLLIVILFGFSALASIYLWQQLEQQKTLLAQATQTEPNLERQISQLNQAMQSRISRLEEGTATNSQLIATLDKLALFNTKELNRLHASNRSDWLLAEAEYLLRLGNQRLNIEHDVSGAEAIFMAADNVLTEIEDPAIYPIRQNLAQEILALQSVAKVDLDGLYLQIQAMIQSLNTLDENSFLRSEDPGGQVFEIMPDAPEGDSVGIKLWQSIWQDLKKALVIRRLDEPVKPLLAPEQSYFLKQNLQLMLEQAGLALLNEDNTTFQQNVTKAHDWLKHYFVQRDASVEAMQATLHAMQTISIERTLPDVSASLRLLKTRIEAMYRAHQLDRNSSRQDLKNDANIAHDQTPANQSEPNAL